MMVTAAKFGQNICPKSHPSHPPPMKTHGHALDCIRHDKIMSTDALRQSAVLTSCMSLPPAALPGVWCLIGSRLSVRKSAPDRHVVSQIERDKQASYRQCVL